MHPANEAYQIQQRDRQEETRQKLYRPGWDDLQAFLADKKYVQSLWDAWMPKSWTDAAAQADEIQMQNLSDKWHAEYCMETWGWTVDQYNKWVDAENKKQREHWTQIDFNEKLRNMEG